jgi:hypothetical protein
MSQNVWATIMPFGPVTNFLLAPNKFFGPALGWPSFQALQNKPEFTCYNLFDNLDTIG